MDDRCASHAAVVLTAWDKIASVNPEESIDGNLGSGHAERTLARELSESGKL
jgi:hypothetical protein